MYMYLYEATSGCRFGSKACGFISQEAAAAAEAAATAAQRAFLEAESSLTLDTSASLKPTTTPQSAEEFVSKSKPYLLAVYFKEKFILHRPLHIHAFACWLTSLGLICMQRQTLEQAPITSKEEARAKNFWVGAAAKAGLCVLKGMGIRTNDFCSSGRSCSTNIWAENIRGRCILLPVFRMYVLVSFVLDLDLRVRDLSFFSSLFRCLKTHLTSPRQNRKNHKSGYSC